MMKKRFSKELVKTREDNEDFQNSTKSWIWDNSYANSDVKVRNHCHVTGKYRDSVYRDCNINIKYVTKFMLYSAIKEL